MIAWLLPIALACTLAEIRTNVCNSLCRQDGADLGYYLERSQECVCGFKKKYDEANSVKFILRTNVKRHGDED